MSLRPIEMQGSIPRTQNVGKIQDQLQQRGQVLQDHLAAEQNREDEKRRKNVTETSETEKKRLNNDDENSGNQGRHEHKKEEKKQEKEIMKYAKHPFKGNHVDFSG